MELKPTFIHWKTYIFLLHRTINFGHIFDYFFRAPWPVPSQICFSKLNFGNSNQGCARLRFFGLTQLWLMWQSRWLNSDSTHTPNFLIWLNSDSTQIPNLLTWLNYDSTHLRIWLTTHHFLILSKVVDRGVAAKCSWMLVLSPVRLQINAKS